MIDHHVVSPQKYFPWEALNEKGSFLAAHSFTGFSTNIPFNIFLFHFSSFIVQESGEMVSVIKILLICFMQLFMTIISLKNIFSRARKS